MWIISTTTNALLLATIRCVQFERHASLGKTRWKIVQVHKFSVILFIHLESSTYSMRMDQHFNDHYFPNIFQNVDEVKGVDNYKRFLCTYPNPHTEAIPTFFIQFQDSNHVFTAYMALTFIRFNVLHRTVELLFNAGLQNFVSSIDYLHLKAFAALNIPDTDVSSQTTSQQQGSSSSDGPSTTSQPQRPPPESTNHR